MANYTLNYSGQEIDRLLEKIDTSFGETTVYSDTVTWDGNPDGLTKAVHDLPISGVNFYRISDATPTYVDFANGVKLLWASGNNSEVSQSTITDLGNGVLLNQQLSFAIAQVDNVTIQVPYNGLTVTATFPKKGVYVISDNGSEIRRFTINGYNGFVITKIDYLDNKFLEPFETTIVGKDTLTWDGNTAGLYNPSGSNLYLVSDALPTYDEMNRNNGSVDIMSSEGEHTLELSGQLTGSGVADQGTLGKEYTMLPASCGLVVYEKNCVWNGIIFEKTGTYFANAPDLGFVTKSLTINGYTGFTEEQTKLKEECLPDGVGGGTPHWDDIEGKPFGEETTTTVMLKDYTFDSEYNNFGYHHNTKDVTGTEVILTSETIDVEFDGVPYTLNMHVDNVYGSEWLYNKSIGAPPSVLANIPDTGEPFAIYSEPDKSTITIYPLDEGEHTISISTTETTLTPIDPKYLPSGGGETVVYKDRIIWDGEIGDKVTVSFGDDTLVCVSDVVPTMTDIQNGAEITTIGNGLESWRKKTGEAIQSMGDLIFIEGGVYIVSTDNFEIPDMFTFPKAGIYFMKTDSDNYTSEFLIRGYDKFNTVVNASIFKIHWYNDGTPHLKESYKEIENAVLTGKNIVFDELNMIPIEIRINKKIILSCIDLEDSEAWSAVNLKVRKLSINVDNSSDFKDIVKVLSATA